MLSTDDERRHFPARIQPFQSLAAPFPAQLRLAPLCGRAPGSRHSHRGNEPFQTVCGVISIAIAPVSAPLHSRTLALRHASPGSDIRALLGGVSGTYIEHPVAFGKANVARAAHAFRPATASKRTAPRALGLSGSRAQRPASGGSGLAQCRREAAPAGVPDGCRRRSRRSFQPRAHRLELSLRRKRLLRPAAGHQSAA